MKPVVLAILDGWGLSPIKEGNAIYHAKTPALDYLQANFPYFVLDASGLAVGLAWGEVGNSEVGHMTLGIGKIIYQPLAMVNMAIENESFFRNKAILAAFAHAKKFKSKLHFVGLYSPGGVHAHSEHLVALLRMARRQKIKEVFLHLFTDGRDTPPFAAERLFTILKGFVHSLNLGTVATLVGRFYAMDRNKNWERVEKAYRLLTEGKGVPYRSFEEAIADSYRAGKSDEFIEPVSMINQDGQPVAKISSNDAVIFFNFREDRARQLAQAFVAPVFTGFTRNKLSNLFLVSFIDYGKEIPVSQIAFPPQEVEETVGGIIAEAGMKQLRLAETEKAAHVTYFLNGGRELAYDGEERILVRSPMVEHFDTVPEMSAGQITNAVLDAIKQRKYNFIVLNFANPDMVAHTGNFEATKRAVSFVDGELRKIYEAALQEDIVLLITGDHGNAEELIDPITGKISKDHSTCPVPFFVVSRDLQRRKSEQEIQTLKLQFQPVGILPDVTATALKFLGLKKPSDFVGKALV